MRCLLCVRLAAVLTTIIQQRIWAGIAENDNQQARAALCGIVAMAGTSSSIGATKTNLDDALQNILELNMSAADQTWVDRFRKEPGSDEAGDFKEDETTRNTDWEGRWSNWKTQAAKILKSQNREQKMKEHKLNILSTDQLAVVRPSIQRLAAEAEEIKQTALALAPDTDFITDAEAQKTINQAVYGTETEPNTGTAINTLFKNPATGRGTSCTAATNGNGLGTAGGTLVCICAADSGGAMNANKAFSGTTPLSSNWAASTHPTNSATDEVLKLCNRKQQTKLTSEVLRRRIDAVTQMLKVTATGSYFGAHLNGDCDGTTANGLCVKYEGITSTAGDPLTTINWIKDLSGVASKLEKQEQAVSTRQAAAAAIQANAAAAKRLVFATHLTPLNLNKQEAQADATKTTTTEEKEKECNTKGKDKQDECEKLAQDGCVFNREGTEGKKCTLNKDVKQKLEKASQTVGNDGKATNTTGSNSIVIHKTPFLLAVLLF
uniref:Variant surface glycoprotein 1125.304 n=1 Tax=Trypanosoma brucei TaxID=5691 RepID=A0A1J0R5K9_9TRYP|nr:variant surface glycoprotein 1125.304 [Trypanosoma brucei]